MLNKMRLLFYLCRKKTNKQGLTPIYYKITINGKVVNPKSTGIYIKAIHWCNRTKTVIGGTRGDSNATLYNTRLGVIRTNFNMVHLQAEQRQEVLTPLTVVRGVQDGPVVPSLCEVIRKLVSKWNKSDMAFNTRRSYESRSKLVIDFLVHKGINSLLITEVKPTLGHMFKEWMKDNGYSSMHTVKCLQIIKAAEQWALHNEYIEFTKLHTVRITHKPVRERLYCTPDELQRIFNLRLCERLERVRKRFIIQCLTGLDYTDTCDISREFLRWKDNLAYLEDRRNKSKINAIIPLVQEVREILEDYHWCLPEISLQKYNKYLKELAEIAEIPKGLTSKSGRYTFGMVMLNRGFPMQTVSRMMGHRSIKTTERIYAQLLPDTILKEAHELGLNLVRRVA